MFLCENCFTRFTSPQEITPHSDNCVKNLSADETLSFLPSTSSESCEQKSERKQISSNPIQKCNAATADGNLSFFCGYCSTQFKCQQELAQHLFDTCKQKTRTNITLSSFSPSTSSDSHEQKSEREHSNDLISLGIFILSKGNAVVFCEYCLTGFKSLQEFTQIHGDTCMIHVQRKHANTLLSVPSSSSESYEQKSESKDISSNLIEVCISSKFKENPTLSSLPSTASDFHKQKSEREQISSKTFSLCSVIKCHENVLIFCPHCTTGFKSLQEFILHIKICPKKTCSNILIFCEHCLTGFKSLQEFVQHINNTCAQEKGTNMSFFCEHCSMVFESFRESIRHSNTSAKENYTNAKFFFCEHCSTGFKPLREFLQHCNTCAQKNCTNVSVFCEHCLTGFNSLRKFVHHRKTCAQEHCTNVTLLSLPSTSRDFYEQKSEREEISCNPIDIYVSSICEKGSLIFCDCRLLEFKSPTEFIEHCKTCTNIHV